MRDGDGEHGVMVIVIFVAILSLSRKVDFQSTFTIFLATLEAYICT